MNRNKALMSFNPWKRSPIPDNEDYYTPDVMYYLENLAEKRPRFLQNKENTYLDINTKRAALSASPFVVSIISYTGDVELNQGSGTIIESSEDNINVVLTSARLFSHPTEDERFANEILADDLKVVIRLFDGRSFEGGVCGHDFHYNIAAVRFKSDSLLPTPTPKLVDDSLDVNPQHCMNFQETSSFQLHRHSSSIKLVPGDHVVAIGRYFATPYEVMAAPGEFSANYCEQYDCKELFNATSRMTQCGDGGPLVNLSGEVMGIAFYDLFFTPFLPINMAYKWWEIYKRDGGQVRRPSLGMEASNFYTADLDVAQKLIEKFPSISKGVIVEKVFPDSCAKSAGLRLNDVIVECAGRQVRSFLELMDILWDHVGLPVDSVVARVGLMEFLHLKMMVAETPLDEINRWPSLKRRSVII